MNKNMSECLFCKIVDKSIPADIVYEDEQVMAFLDINPVNPGHALVVPKQHKEFFWELEAGTCGPVSVVIQKIMHVLVHDLGYEGVNLIQNNGPASGQVIPHVHFHIIPRKVGDGHAHWRGTAYEAGEQAMMAEKIKTGLSA